MPASPLDLTTVASVKQWMPGVQAPDNLSTDAVLQSAITAASLDMLRRTGRGPRNWQVATQSPYNQVVTYTETYDGTGTPRLFLRNFPIMSVTSLSVFGTTVTASTSQASPGFVIDGTARSIALISPFSGSGGWAGSYYGTGRWPAFGLGVLARFPIGVQNITVTYTAGFNAQIITNELQTVPALPAVWAATTNYTNGSQVYAAGSVQTASLKGSVQVAASGSSTPGFSASLGGTAADGTSIIWTNSGPPYSVAANVLPWLSLPVAIPPASALPGVSYFSSGIPLTQVFTAPTIGQYFIQAPGSYLFAAADASAQILLNYQAAGTPPDLSLAVTKMVFLTYKRRGWEGLRSTSQKDVGQTNYSAWEVSPEVLEVIENYRRRALTG